MLFKSKKVMLLKEEKTMNKLSVYVIISLTHVKTDEEKQKIRHIISWIRDSFNVELLTWAFDIDLWQPKPVENIYLFDKQRALSADLAIIFFLSSDGSDGRGGEIVLRAENGLPMLACAHHGIKISRFPSDCLKLAGVEITPFKEVEELQELIRKALEKVLADRKDSKSLRRSARYQADLLGVPAFRGFCTKRD